MLAIHILYRIYFGLTSFCPIPPRRSTYAVLLMSAGYEYNHILFLRLDSAGYDALPTGRQSTTVRKVLLTCFTITGNKKTIEQWLLLLVYYFVR